jgi:hypothetical protein
MWICGCAGDCEASRQGGTYLASDAEIAGGGVRPLQRDPVRSGRGLLFCQTCLLQDEPFLSGDLRQTALAPLVCPQLAGQSYGCKAKTDQGRAWGMFEPSRFSVIDRSGIPESEHNILALDRSAGRHGSLVGKARIGQGRAPQYPEGVYGLCAVLTKGDEVKQGIGGGEGRQAIQLHADDRSGLPRRARR